MSLRARFTIQEQKSSNIQCLQITWNSGRKEDSDSQKVGVWAELHPLRWQMLNSALEWWCLCFAFSAMVGDG